MIRKMQSKAANVAIPAAANAVRLIQAQFIKDSAIMALLVMLAVWLLSFPADANEGHAQPAEPLTVVTQDLPANFQVQAADAGLDVVGIERLLSLGTHILTVQTVNGTSSEQMMQVLNATFPAMEFVQMNGTDERFELIEY